MVQVQDNSIRHEVGTISTARCTAALLLLVAVAGCGPQREQEAPQLPSIASTRATPQALDLENGLTLNGLSFNGLSFNGLSFNGLSFNGLAPSGLATAEFSTWFQQDEEAAAQVMSYLVRCAVVEGESRTYQAPHTGRLYTWPGLLGLAPGWAAGQPANEAEQQVLSACLAAHANLYGVSLPISVLGRGAQGRLIPYTSEEISLYSQKEAVYFGNLFTGGAVYVCSYRHELKSEQSTPRVCGMLGDKGDPRASCPPMVHLGPCKALCTLNEDKLSYASCTWEGTIYRPITTRMRSEDFYRCGDGVCQFTERCGHGQSFNDCELDCGTCD